MLVPCRSACTLRLGARQFVHLGRAAGCRLRHQLVAADPIHQGLEVVDADRFAEKILDWGERRAVFFYFLSILGMSLQDRLDRLALAWVEDAIRIGHQHFI